MHDSGILSPKAVDGGFRPYELRFLPHICCIFMLGSCIMSRINMHYFMHISVKSIRFRCMIRKHISLRFLHYVTHKYALFDAYFGPFNALYTDTFEAFFCFEKS